ncbi:hypothetical protein DV735_g4, partial [Chaetothyriales sp. CBS 134920]
MAIGDLPEDITPLILSYLSPADYLAFCCSSKSLYHKYRQDSYYWRSATAATFRLPISPLLAADGPRWYWLYKKLSTQTRLYTWGQGLRGSLGQGVVLPTHNRVPVPFRGLRGRFNPTGPHRPRQVFQRTSSSWPTEAHVPHEVGVVADLQCGGWSTSILSSAGKLYVVGSLDSLNGITIGETSSEFKQLEYLSQSTSPIRQFSAGRRHILGLTDDGDILTWDRINAKGLKVFPRAGRDFGGRPLRVAAGWGLSSAYVPETGIVYWAPLKNDQSDESLDGLHVKEKVIPNTAHTTSSTGGAEVIKHIVLETFIIWITSDSKLWACHTDFQSHDSTEPQGPAFEVPGYAAPGRELKDLQGQFESFGVFTAAGEVLAGSVSYLNTCAEVLGRTPDLANFPDSSALRELLASRPPDVPALQHSGVIALAYGDYHYHALHASGHVTTYGRDSQTCGQLGLSHLYHGGRFRGLRNAATGPDAILHPIALRRGRQIWFEPEKKDWLEWLENELRKGDFPHSGRLPIEEWDDWDRQALFSEWIEQEGRHWADGPREGGAQGEEAELKKKTDTEDREEGSYEDLDPYFTIAIAAAGWHSGALVLVDEDKAAQVRSQWVKKITDPHQPHGPSVPGAFEAKDDGEIYRFTEHGFPKVTLPDGYTMPGKGEPRPWREGIPTLEQLGVSPSAPTAGATDGPW